MDDLVTWLRAQLDRETALVNAGIAAPPRGQGPGTWKKQRDVEAKRKIIDECERVSAAAPGNADVTGLVGYALGTLAAIYLDRPGYREEWRP